MLLQCVDINSFYGMSHILFDVSIELDEGEAVCVLGRNGAGKSTFIKSIIGLIQPRSGSVKFLEQEIRGKQPFQIAREGIGYVPEDRIIFPDLSVKENLELPVQRKKNNRNKWNIDKVCRIFPVLGARLNQGGGTLSGGEQQMLTIARSLMADPKVLLLDEPSEGLAPLIVQELRLQVIELKKKGMPILLCEQNSVFVLNLSDRAYILEKGHVKWKGDVTELSRTPEIMKRFLGI